MNLACGNSKEFIGALTGECVHASGGRIQVSVAANFDEICLEELQAAILEKMRKNAPVTDYMLRTVRENTHHGFFGDLGQKF